MAEAEELKIEKDTAEILSGVRGGVTLGSPIAIKSKQRLGELGKYNGY